MFLGFLLQSIQNLQALQRVDSILLNWRMSEYEFHLDVVGPFR